MRIELIWLGYSQFVLKYLSFRRENKVLERGELGIMYFITESLNCIYAIQNKTNRVPMYQTVLQYVDNCLIDSWIHASSEWKFHPRQYTFI